MSRTRKIAAYVLSALWILSSIILPAAGSEYTETVNKEADFLAAIGVMDGKADDGAQVTRAEFADIVVKAIGVADSIPQSSNERLFTDVPPDYWAAGSISVLFKLNIMTGLEDASFKPDENVKYGEAIKAMVCAAGYQKSAEAYGGYPIGYLSVAQQKGIAKGQNASVDTAITRGMLAKLIYHAIQTDMMIMSSIGDSAEFEVQKGKTILSEKLNIIKATGIVTEVGKVSIAAARSSIAEEEVLIGGNIYNIGKTNSIEFLGMKTEYYYYDTKGNDRNILMYIQPDMQAEQIIDVNSDDILAESSTTKLYYTLSDGSKRQEAGIPADARIIYNNKLLAIVSDADLMPQTGSVRLIDADGDDLYETIIIKDYKTYVVDSTVPLDGVAYTKYGGGELLLDPNLSESYIKFYKDGEPADFSAISEWSVLSVLKSKNITGEKYVSVYISTASVQGEVKELTTTTGEEAITLADEKSYPFSSDFIEKINQGLSDSSYPKIGKEFTFYLDIFGKIAAYDSGSNFSLKYGYLVNAAESGTLSQIIQFKIFTSAGNMEILDSDEKIIFCGTQVNGAQALGRLKLNGVVVPQLIAYETSADNKITAIKAAEDKTAENGNIAGRDEFNLAYRSLTSGIRVYKGLVQGKQYAVGTKTAIFEIPSDITREKDFKVGRKFAIDEGVPAPISLYNVAKGGEIGAMVMSTATSQDMSRPFIVEKVTSAVDEEDNAGIKISFSNGSPVMGIEDDVTYDIIKDWGYDNVKMHDLKAGDIIQYSLINNKVNSLRVVLRVNKMGDLRIDEDTIVENGHQFARVCSVSDDNKLMVIEYKASGTAKRETRRIEGTIKRYNSSTKKVVTSSAGDVGEGDLIYLNTFWLSTKFIVIYR